MESQPPVIHDIVTSSPSDHEQLEATPFMTNISLGVPLDILTSEVTPVDPREPSVFPVTSEGPVTEQPLDSPSDIHPTPAGAAEEIPAVTAESGFAITAETLTAGDLPSAHAEADVVVGPERAEPSVLAGDQPVPETVGSEETEEETTAEKEETEQSEIQDEMDEDEEEEEEGMRSISVHFLN